MRAVVTGGCGFIGRHLVRALLARDMSVTILDDCSSSTSDGLPADRRLTFHRGCVTDRGMMQQAVEGAATIFHLASVVGQLNVCRYPGWSAEVSAASVRNINAVAPGIPLVLFSSSAVYGVKTETLCLETSPVDEAVACSYDGGVKGYAYGKWMAEVLALQRPGPTLIIRPFNVIGPGQTGTYGMVVPRFVQNAMLVEPVTIFGSGDQTRSFGDVERFIDHFLALVDKWAAGRTGHNLFNIGTQVTTSINQLIDTIDRVLGTRTPRLRIRFEDVYPGKSDVQHRRPSAARLEAILGPLSWPPLECTIAHIAATIQQHVVNEAA